jgi:hypothetical protein
MRMKDCWTGDCGFIRVSEMTRGGRGACRQLAEPVHQSTVPRLEAGPRALQAAQGADPLAATSLRQTVATL